jgi:demethylmenaquinone methyltransferase / 2-methoxy-6-polyprenyl-1,4-benzoquinol methylase
MTGNSTPALPDPTSSTPKDHQVREMFGRIAGTYDLLNRILSFGTDQSWRKYAICHLQNPAPARVLDLCGGTGDMAVQLLIRRPQDSVVVADFAYPMLEKAQRRVTACSQKSGVLCGDALALPFPDGLFDICLCAFGVRNFSDPLKGMKEVHRILRAGGELAVLDFLRSQDSQMERLKRLYIQGVLPVVGFIASGDGQAYRYLAESMEKFYSGEEFLAAAHTAGFKVTHRKRFFLGSCWCFMLRKV